jgi:hypothetical protein
MTVTAVRRADETDRSTVSARLLPWLIVGLWLTSAAGAFWLFEPTLPWCMPIAQHDPATALPRQT